MWLLNLLSWLWTAMAWLGVGCVACAALFAALCIRAGQRAAGKPPRPADPSPSPSPSPSTIDLTDPSYPTLDSATIALTRATEAIKRTEAMSDKLDRMAEKVHDRDIWVDAAIGRMAGAYQGMQEELSSLTARVASLESQVEILNRALGFHDYREDLLEIPAIPAHLTFTKDAAGEGN